MTDLFGALRTPLTANALLQQAWGIPEPGYGAGQTGAYCSRWTKMARYWMCGFRRMDLAFLREVLIILHEYGAAWTATCWLLSIGIQGRSRMLSSRPMDSVSLPPA